MRNEGRGDRYFASQVLSLLLAKVAHITSICSRIPPKHIVIVSFVYHFGGAELQGGVIAIRRGTICVFGFQHFGCGQLRFHMWTVVAACSMAGRGLFRKRTEANDMGCDTDRVPLA